jgi:hypothetical protein
MNSRFAASPSENAAPTSKTRSRRGRSAPMSEKQTQAYLLARDAVRRIRRISSLLAVPSGADPDFARRSEAHPGQGCGRC